MKQPGLRQLLAWTQTVITHPETATAGAELPEAQAVVPGPRAVIDQVIRPTAKLSGLERLAIYARAYHARLRDCLADDHPVLWYALGLVAGGDRQQESLVTDVLSAYVGKHPSIYYSLDHFGRHLPDFLESSTSTALLPLAPRRFFVELARLERVQCETFHLADPTPLDASALAGLGGEAVLGARLQLSPGVSLLRHDYPVHRFLMAWSQGEQPAIPAPDREHVVAFKRHHKVWRIRVSQPGFAILRALQRGRTVGRALEIALRLATPAPGRSGLAGREAEGDPAAFTAGIFASFREWSEEGLFSVLIPGATRT